MIIPISLMEAEVQAETQAQDASIYLSSDSYQKLAKDHRSDEPGEWQWVQPFDETVKESSIWTGTGNFQYQYWFEDFSDDCIIHRTNPTQEIMASYRSWRYRPFEDKLSGNCNFENDLEELHEEDVFQGWTMIEIVHPDIGNEYHHGGNGQGKVITHINQKIETSYRFYYRDQMVTIKDSPNSASLQLGDDVSYYYFRETNSGAVYHWFNRGDVESYIKVTFKN